MVRPDVVQRGVVITGIADPLLQATARTVETAVATADKKRRTADPANHRLTRESYDRTVSWIESQRATPKPRTPIDKLSAEQQGFLLGPAAPATLKELSHLIDLAEAARVEEPIFLGVPVNAIVDRQLRDCAVAITLGYSQHPPKDLLTTGQLNAALDEMAKSGDPDFAPSKPYEWASANPEFNRKNLESLNIYMRTGLGGLTNHGSIEGNGYELDRVFKLPLLASVTLPDGKPFDQQPQDKKQQYLSQTITAYETQFAKTGYDRIYVIGDDDGIYVGLHDKGVLTNLGPGATMVFSDPSRYHDNESTRLTGRIERVVDVNNTWQEASFGMVGRVLSGWADTANNLFNDATKKPLEALSAVSGKLPTDPTKAPAGVSPFVVAAGFAGIAAAFPHGHDLGMVIGVGVAGVLAATTGLNVWNVYRTGKDITPFLGATGHVLNTKALRSDDI